MKFSAIKALSDNYMYLFYDDKIAISVDPVEYLVIKDALSRKLSKKFYYGEELKNEDKCPERRLLYNLTTHSHYDHAGGNYNLKNLFEDTVFVSAFEEDKKWNDGDLITHEKFSIECIHTSCHTRDSFCYFLRTGDSSYLLTGDTVFFLGCGRFFEGNGEDMVKCLNKISERVRDDSSLLLYGHNYNKVNISFASNYVEIPDSIVEKMFLTLGEEKKYNPFFRIAASKSDNASSQMQDLRNKKDMFGLGNVAY